MSKTLRFCPQEYGAHRFLVLQIRGEQGIASGIRRIEAAAGPAALEYLDSRDAVVKQLSSQLKVGAGELPARVAGASSSPNTASSGFQMTPDRAVSELSSVAHACSQRTAE